MKRGQLIELLSFAAAVTAAIAALTLTVSDFNGIGESKVTMLLGIVASVNAAIISIYISRMKQKRMRQRRVFIMYNHADRAAAQELVQKLKASGYNPWFDADEIAPGQKIAETIVDGISQSAVAILLVSKNLNLEKSILGEELKVALATMTSKDESFSPVIPIKLDEAEVPQALAGIHWIDMRGKESFEKLEKGLKRVLGA
jgi:isopentenyl diphosphate isomerase/L-lactate dehydrogenase-like FMN-dependent dehydrogenase